MARDTSGQVLREDLGLAHGDANLVATVLEHGIGTIVTLNVDDFVDFAVTWRSSTWPGDSAGGHEQPARRVRRREGGGDDRDRP